MSCPPRCAGRGARATSTRPPRSSCAASPPRRHRAHSARRGGRRSPEERPVKELRLRDRRPITDRLRLRHEARRGRQRVRRRGARHVSARATAGPDRGRARETRASPAGSGSTDARLFTSAQDAARGGSPPPRRRAPRSRGGVLELCEERGGLVAFAREAMHPRVEERGRLLSCRDGGRFARRAMRRDPLLAIAGERGEHAIRGARRVGHAGRDERGADPARAIGVEEARAEPLPAARIRRRRVPGREQGDRRGGRERGRDDP